MWNKGGCKRSISHDENQNQIFLLNPLEIMSNSALFRFYCETNTTCTTDSSSSSSETEAYDDSATTTTSTEPNILCEVTVSNEKAIATSGPSSRTQLMELLFDIYCLLNGFFRSLLDSNSTIRGKCSLRDSCSEMTILDILQRIVDREILVDEKCRKYPALIPMLTAINRKFQFAEGLFSEAVEETKDNELMDTIVESVANIQNYFECMQVMNSTEKEVESDLQEILCYLDYPLMDKKATAH